MSANMALQKTHVMRAGTRDAVVLGCVAIVVADGEIGTVLGDPGLNVEETATGTYKFTFPKLNTEQQKRTRFLIQVVSPLLKMVNAVITESASLADGELTFKAIKADGTAVEPDALDAFMISFYTTSSGTRQ